MNELESFYAKYAKYGFKSVEKTELCNILCGAISILHVDLYADNPYTLLLRSVAKRVSARQEDERLKINGNDKNVLMNIPLDVISDCVIKQYGTKKYEMLISAGGISYKLLVEK